MATVPPLYPVDTNRILRRREVLALLGISRSMLYAKLLKTSKYFDPTFPSQISLGSNSVGWKYSDVMQWIESRTNANKVE